MQEKLDIYDIVGVLVPGVLVVATVQIAFPQIGSYLPEVQLPEGFAFVILTALSIFTGYLVQSGASLCELPLNWTWGGRSSEKALDKGLGDRYLPQSSGARIRHKLAKVAEANASSRSLFLLAMQVAESSGSPRVSQFNALYAYHRALLFMTLVALVIFLISFRNGLASKLTCKQNAVTLTVLILLSLLFWYRAKQRGYYYVREVLLCAEQQIDSRKSDKGS